MRVTDRHTARAPPGPPMSSGTNISLSGFITFAGDSFGSKCDILTTRICFPVFAQ